MAELEKSIRQRCYGCYRPTSLCFCDRIPSVQNLTHVLIMQHMRERFHPFNTARILRKSLKNCSLLVDHNREIAERLETWDFGDRAGVLYPGPDGEILDQVPPSERPRELIVIDGTWHHAKTLVRDVPRLGRLPRYRIAPQQPGQYRIRREPNESALSTLEATVAALRSLEPETVGLDQLIEAFNSMVETQLAHPEAKSKYSWRQNLRRSNNPMGIPKAVTGDLNHLVVAYGESEPGLTGQQRVSRKNHSRRPVYWVAQRVGTGESFRCVIQTDAELDETFLGHIGLGAEVWNSRARSVDQFRQEWNQFLQPTDSVATYNKSTLRLLESCGINTATGLVLKSVKFDPMQRHQTLDSFLQSKAIVPPASSHPGRAGQRLANAIALVQHLRAISQTRETS